MVTNYEQLTAEERTTIMVMAEEGKSLRTMARLLHRAPSTSSRKWRRHAVTEEAAGTRGYDVKRAGQAARRQRFKPRRAAGHGSSGGQPDRLEIRRGLGLSVLGQGMGDTAQLVEPTARGTVSG
jgi:hypothetical protein